MGQVHEDLAWEKGEGLPGLSRAVPTVSLRWTKLPPVKPAIRGQAPVVPYMRYGHSTVLVDDTVFLWGGRNDTEGACNVLFAFDVSEYGSLRASWWVPGRGGVADGTGKRAPGVEEGVSEVPNQAILSSSDTHKWSTPRVSGAVPGARDGHSACVLGKIMYIFGGYEQLVSLGKNQREE